MVAIIITSVTQGDILRQITCLPVTTSGIKNHREETVLSGWNPVAKTLASPFGRQLCDPTPQSKCLYLHDYLIFQLFSQALSPWSEPFGAGKTFAAAASAENCKCKPKSPAFFLFSSGDSKEGKFLITTEKSYSYIWIRQHCLSYCLICNCCNKIWAKRLLKMFLIFFWL